MKKLKKILVLALALLMSLTLVACSSDTSDDTSDDAGDDTATETTYKTHFTYALGDSPSYLDPAIASDSIGAYVINQTSYPLFQMSQDGVSPCAVEDYTVSEDGLTYTLTLRDNSWSDGQAVVAEDYIYGIKHALSIGSGEVTYLTWITNNLVGAAQYDGADVDSMTELTGAVATDDKTIVFTLVQPCDYFTSLLAGGVYYAVRSDYAPSGDYTYAESADVPTNGAFKYSSIDRADRIEFAKNEYFCDAEQVTLETMTAVVMADMEAQLMAYQTGEIDYATSVDAATVGSLYTEGKEIDMYPSVINYYIEFNTREETNTNAALLDVNVRRAFQLAIDRQAVVDALDAGDAYYPLYGFVPSGISSDEGDFREVGGDLVTYDKEKAIELLAASGYSVDNPVTIEYYYNQNTMHDTVAAVVKAQLAEVGINLELKTGDVRVFFADRDDEGNYEAARGAMSADYLDPTTYLDMATTSYQNCASWGDTTYDEMMNTAASLSGQERTDELHAAEKYLVEETAQVCPLFGYQSVCLQPVGMTGSINSPQGNSTFWFVKVPVSE